MPAAPSVRLTEWLQQSAGWIGTTAETKLVLVVVLLEADEAGQLRRSLAAVAKMAEVSAGVCECALQTLTDRSHLVTIDGGWALTADSVKCREIRTRKQVLAALRQRTHRQGK